MGALLGIGIAVVTGQDKRSSQSPGDAGGPSGAAGGVPTVTVLSAIVHPVTAPAGETTKRARVSVHARVRNATGRVVTPAQPVLLVGDVHVRPAADTGGSANPLLAPIDPGGVADGRLRFDTDGAITGQLTTTEVQLRLVGKTLPVKPKIGYPTNSG